MIIGILINAKKIAERKDSRSSSFFNIKDFSDKTQKQKLEKNLIFTLDNQLIQNELPLIWEKFHEDFENINLKITYHSPKLFDELLMNDKKFLDLDISLAIEANLDQIKSSSKADGGRGGQFFFFSFDNQIIIKSLSNDDFKCMKKILKPYYEHMINNQNSLIMKIYGIYDFAFFNKKNSKSCIFSQKVMIMRNLTGYPKIFVEKIYDLKGSTFQRESLMNKQLKDNVVLKDIDFLKKEKRLFIESEKKKTLLETLKKDSAFFKVNGIIDYSLLVIKINTENSPKIEGWNKKIVAMNGLWSLASIKETGYMYHIGIIDYLQPYNYKKIFEKYSKKFIKANINLDTSSQDPFMYSDRFCKFVEGILSEEIEENDNK